MYTLARALLFKLSAETAHDISIDALGVAQRLRILPLIFSPLASQPVSVMGLTFANAVGLAAGLDKNGDAIDALGQLGFGHLELGTVTPRPQPGNPKPRLFRLVEEQGIINRMGFNNKGVDYLVERVKAAKFDGIIGINIGKNKETSEADALSDYQYCLQKAWPVADYITINLSSPNTPGLRDLQFGEPLRRLLAGVASTREALKQEHGKSVPVAVKLAPDMSDEDLQQVVEDLIAFGIDAIIATNTTISRDTVLEHPLADEKGGLSGAPVLALANEKLAVICEAAAGRIPVIGVGGVSEADDAVEKLRLGASLVQIYSGFIFQGPDLVKQSVLATNAYHAVSVAGND